jgi:hypothetical protein
MSIVWQASPFIVVWQASLLPLVKGLARQTTMSKDVDYHRFIISY